MATVGDGQPQPPASLLGSEMKSLAHHGAGVPEVVALQHQARQAEARHRVAGLEVHSLAEAVQGALAIPGALLGRAQF